VIRPSFGSRHDDVLAQVGNLVDELAGLTRSESGSATRLVCWRQPEPSTVEGSERTEVVLAKPSSRRVR
jgi:hypothetical protein